MQGGLFAPFYDLPTQPPMDEEFERTPASSPRGRSRVVERSALANGVGVVSVDDGLGAASVELFVRGGSSADAVAGTAFVVEDLAFGATRSRSALKLFRDVEAFGGAVSATAEREYLSFGVHGLRDHAGSIVSSLAEAVLQPRLASWDVSENVSGAALRGSLARGGASERAIDAVHIAAYGGQSPLGHPVFCPHALGAISHETVREFLGRTFEGGGMVLVGANIAHDVLEDLADTFFLSAPRGQGVEPAQGAWEGGVFVDADAASSTTHVAVAFPGAPVAQGAVQAVASEILGSRPRSGKGCGSPILASASFPAASAFAATYHATGLFGVQARVDSNDVQPALQGIAGALKQLAAGEFNEAELSRAKAALSVARAASLDRTRGAAHDLGYAALFGQQEATGNSVKAIQAVSKDDVATFAQNALKQHPAVGIVGNPYATPRYDKIAALFH